MQGPLSKKSATPLAADKTELAKVAMKKIASDVFRPVISSGFCPHMHKMTKTWGKLSKIGSEKS